MREVSSLHSIVFWQDSLSIHQAPLLRALAVLGNEVTVAVEEGLQAQRANIGWEMPDFDGCKVVVQPSRDERLKIAENLASNCFHVISGIHAYPETYWTLKRLLRSSSKVGIFLEQVNDAGLKGFLKRQLYRVHAMRFRKKLGFVLACGKKTLPWLVNRGFSSKTIYSFGYFTQFPDRDGFAYYDNLVSAEAFKVTYLGALIPRKQVSLLVESLHLLRDFNWNLEIIGDGPEKESIVHQVERLGIEDRVDFVGSLPNALAMSRLNLSDLLILPSRFDGWGAVVNEALQCGATVLTSDACGACDLVGDNNVGRIFRSGSAEDLRNQLEAVLRQGKLSLKRRAKNQDWARKSISPEVGASYLLKILDHCSGDSEEKPLAPWHQNSPV